MRLVSGPGAKLFLIGCLLAATVSRAVTLEEIRNTRDLTPQKFADFFRNFEFKFHNEVQNPEIFLATQSGDCDDYAILAATILKEKGYTTRLVTVRMPKITHVVCYVAETNSYLDYNNRGSLSRTVSSGPGINEIALKVARSYKAKWSSASEFTYADGVKRLVKTVQEQPRDNSRFAALLN
jgi:hypothetical protein